MKALLEVRRVYQRLDERVQAHTLAAPPALLLDGALENKQRAAQIRCP